MHIVSYRCESCGARHARRAGLRCDGMCPTCRAPMMIEDLFSDRRVVSLPVPLERRALAA